MPSRLSSLLVRDGLVGVKRMEKAFQRQVIYGGSLDTILLEMNLLGEERLTQYLALASGLPPADRQEGRVLDGDALALFADDVAQQFRAVPLSLEGDALRVLVCAPVEITELEDLADLLDRPLQPLITPEFRWHEAFSNAYGTDIPARFETLARQVTSEPAPPPVGRTRSIIIDDHPVAAEARVHTWPLVPAVPRSPARAAPVIVQEMSADASGPATAAGQAVADEAALRVTFTEAAVSDPRRHPDTLVGAAPAPTPGAHPLTVSPRNKASSVPPGTVRVPRRDTPPIVTAGRDSPIAVVPARELLATAEDRDTVFLTLLRAARSRARYAGLLTVQGGAAIGRVALAEHGIDTAAIARVLIPLDAFSPFRQVVQHQQSHIGALTSGDPSIDSMALRLGGNLPPSALILPIVLRERVVALVVAHRVHSDLKLVDVTELLPLASAAADALGRLIVKHKAAGYRTPAPQPEDSAPRIVIEGDQIDTKKVVRVDSEWRVPPPGERLNIPALDDQPELLIVSEPPRAIEEVIDDIEASKEGGAEEPIADAVERASETLGVLVKRFPGKLRVERFAISGRALRAAQYGGLLELVVRLGATASELLIEKMSAPQRDVRFYATVCAAELRPRNAVYALVERLFDQDYGVRATAIEALAGYSPQDLSHALARARRAVRSTDPEVVAAATTAIVELGDIEAIGDLIGALERSDRGSDHVRRALAALTAQDFGLRERKWRKWWEASRRKHRIEWLIAGLLHKDDGIRENAINQLRRLTGEYFGYHYDLPRREREQAAERWSTWWVETGLRRFMQRGIVPEDERQERNRPTAQVLVRKD
jgi:hypothetical protein